MLLLDYWLPIPKYAGKYDASFSGKIRRNETREFKKYHLDKDGYLCVNMPPKGNKRVHRLVALTFIPNPDRLPQVNHKDGNKQNACANNFEWVTQIRNRQHAQEIGLYKSAIKPTPEQVSFIEKFKMFLTQKEISERLNLPSYVVLSIRGNVGVRRGKITIDLSTGIFWTTDELSFIMGKNRKEVCRILNEERKPNTTQYRYA